MTVAELLDRISSAELTEWMAFAQVEPFGTDIDLIGHAITASTIANVNRGKNQKPHKVEEFMPKFGKPKEQSPEEMLQFAEMMTAAMGGVDKRGE